MRVTLDNHKSYDIAAMFTPLKVGRNEAWAAFRNNLSALPNGLRIPFHNRATLRGTFSWLVVLGLHLLSLPLLPLISLFGYSMKAYCFFTRENADQMARYREDLKKTYAKLSAIEDSEEYMRRLKEEIDKVKPY